ncbi:MAG: hypothetical protein HSCHL_0753 [Hydrogenibacillus schlegelii]|uniref:Uncharacterized protein n=1 Tax=Hydrogenibacillus schlegelii TaxID=1484 RepID=A0A2T5GD52_HYDSH|nr:MAG: hypothetical protein HSCHL_0753 [Hydrogenibacillus schlegelii]
MELLGNTEVEIALRKNVSASRPEGPGFFPPREKSGIIRR